MAINIVKPVVGGDGGNWGNKLNSILDSLVAEINNTPRIVNGVLVAPDGSVIDLPDGEQFVAPDQEEDPSIAVRETYEGEDLLGVKKTSSGHWTGFVTRDADGKAYLRLGRKADGTMFPFEINSLMLPPVINFEDDSMSARFLQRTTDVQSALGYATVVTAIGGQRMSWSAARQGGAPARATVTDTTNPGKIPGDGTQVLVTLDRQLRSDTAPVTCSIAGVRGQFTAIETSGTNDPLDPGGASKTYFTGMFKRNDDVSRRVDVIVPSQTPVFREGVYNAENVPTPVRGIKVRSQWPIHWPGRHDFWRNPGQVINVLKREISYISEDARQKCLILECAPFTGTPSEALGTPRRAQLDNFNLALRDEFPTMFVPMNSWLQSAATVKLITGNVATAQDIADIAAGFTPTTFRLESDGTTVNAGHPNPDGVTAVLFRIQSEYLARGWGPIQWQV